MCACERQSQPETFFFFKLEGDRQTVINSERGRVSANDREKWKGETERQPDREKKIKSEGERQTGRGREADRLGDTERETQREGESVCK